MSRTPGDVVLIVNPRSGRGRALNAAPLVEGILKGAGWRSETLVTTGAGHAVQIARAAARSGVPLLALGGDGTLNECVNGVLQEHAASEANQTVRSPAPSSITPLPLGTGNSFVRDFGLEGGDWRGALDRFLAGNRRTVDVGHVAWGAGTGGQSSEVMSDERQSRPGTEGGQSYFINVFGTGFMASVADATNNRFKVFRGLGYSISVIWNVAGLQAPLTSLLVDGDVVADHEPLTLVAVCNSQWTGDKMWIAPYASLDDGELDVLTAGRLSRMELLRIFPRIFSGTHLKHQAVRHFRAKRVEIHTQPGGPLLMDGEVRGATPVRIRICPKALTIAL